MKNQIAQDAPNQTKQIRCKLTDQNLKTYNGFQWELGKKRVASGKGELCSSGWLHCYTHPLLAILLNPVHANIKNPRLFEIEVGGKMKTDNGLKEGWTGMALVKEIEIPEISLTQKIAFGILCSLEVYKEESYVIWAKNWLNNVDRTDLAAARAARAAVRRVLRWNDRPVAAVSGGRPAATSSPTCMAMMPNTSSGSATLSSIFARISAGTSRSAMTFMSVPRRAVR